MLAALYETSNIKTKQNNTQFDQLFLKNSKLKNFRKCCQTIFIYPEFYLKFALYDVLQF